MTTFIESSAPAGNDVYLVRAVNSDGKGEVSNAESVKVAEPAVVSAPNRLTSSAVSSKSIQLKWEGDHNATGYQILRSADGSTNWSAIGTSKGRTFTDTGLTAGTRYFYRIVPIGADGATATSNTLIGQTKLRDKGELTGKK